MTLSKKTVRNKLANLIVAQINAAAPSGPWGKLKGSFRWTPRGPNGANIFSLYYWARFVNDGRRAVEGKLMFFFDHPDNDPRLNFDYPRKRGDVKHLSADDIRKGKEDGTIRVVRQVAAIPATKFIEVGLRNARPLGRKEMRAQIKTDVRRMIKKRRDFIKVQL